MAMPRGLRTAVALAAGSALAVTLGFAAVRAAPIDNELADKQLLFPLPLAQSKGLRDSFSESRGGHRHEAVDIMAPRGTPVRAVDNGRIAKLFTSVPGGKTIYQFDATDTYTYYYAHLDRYADGLADGALVKRGDVIGYVGSTGNAAPNAPHLHFAIFRLGMLRQWWKGEAIDPYPYLVTAAKTPER